MTKDNLVVGTPQRADATDAQVRGKRARLIGGEYRILAKIDDERLIIAIVEIGQRKDVYK